MNLRVYELTKIMDFYKSSAFWHHRTPANTFFCFFEKRKTRVKIVKKCVKKSKKITFLIFEVFLQSFDEIRVDRSREKNGFLVISGIFWLTSMNFHDFKSAP